MAVLTDLRIEGSPATAAAINGGGAHYLMQDRLKVLQDRLKVLFWLGFTTFTLAIAWKRAEVKPPEIDLAFWTVAEFVALVGFHRLFVHGLPNTNYCAYVLWVLAIALNIIIMGRTVKRLPTTLVVFVCAKTSFVVIWAIYAVFLSRVVSSAPILPLLNRVN